MVRQVEGRQVEGRPRMMRKVDGRAKMMSAGDGKA